MALPVQISGPKTRDPSAPENGQTLPFPPLQDFPECDPRGGDDVLWLTLPMRNVADLLHKRGIDIRHKTVLFLCNSLGSTFPERRDQNPLEKYLSINLNDLRPRDGWMPVAFPTPLALAKVLSRSGYGRIFSLFSRVMRMGLLTGHRHKRPG